MPRLRKPPNPDTERRISARLRELRQASRLSQSELAQLIGVTRAYISNTEAGRSPLRYQAARHALRAAGQNYGLALVEPPFNPLWLAGEQDWPIQLSWPMLLPDAMAIGLNPAARFSDFVSDNRSTLQALAKEPPEAELPEAWLSPYALHFASLRSRLAQVDTGVTWLGLLFEFSAERFCRKSPVAARLLRQVRELLKKSEGRGLTAVTPQGNVIAMQSEIPKMIQRLKQATAPRGRKAELARFMDVDPPRVSEWLSGSKKPSGETTLRLLRWVEQEEAKQQQSASSVQAPPAPQTQPKAQNEKHRKSSPLKE